MLLKLFGSIVMLNLQKGQFNIWGQETISGPGSKGSTKWWIDPKTGKIRYDERPKGKKKKEPDLFEMYRTGQIIKPKTKTKPEDREKFPLRYANEAREKFLAEKIRELAKKDKGKAKALQTALGLPDSEKKSESKKNQISIPDDERPKDVIATPMEAARCIAGQCDGAKELDGVGFNKLDAKRFEYLSNMDWDEMPYSMKVELYEMMKKYKKQLAGMGITDIEKPDGYTEKQEADDPTEKDIILPEEKTIERIDIDSDWSLSTNSRVRIQIKDGRGWIDTPYNAEFVSDIRSVKSRSWDSLAKLNRFDADDIMDVIRIANKHFPDDKLQSILDGNASGAIEFYSQKDAEKQEKLNAIPPEKLKELDEMTIDPLVMTKEQINKNPVLSDWERTFTIDNLGKNRNKLSSKQLMYIDKIKAKLENYLNKNIDEKLKLYGQQETAIKAKQEKEKQELAAVESLIKSQQNDKLELPAALNKAELRGGDMDGYQKKGVNWLLDVERGVLGFDTGLGKTLISITTTMKAQETPAIVQKLEAQGLRSAALLTVPKSLIYNWLDEIKKWDGTKKTVIIDGTPAQREKAYADAMDADFVITTYGMVQREPEKLKALKCGMKFFDEGTRLKGKNTLTFKNANEHLNDGFVVNMSATPMPNRPEEIYNIMKMINPSVLGTFASFKNDFCITEKMRIPGKSFTIDKIIGYRNLEKLKTKLQPYIFMKKRSSPDVEFHLPEVQHINASISMDDDQLKYYRKAQTGLLDSLASVKNKSAIDRQEQSNILTSLMRMRQVAVSPQLIDKDYKKLSPKFDEVISNLDDHFSSYPDKGVVIFSEFNEAIDAMTQHLIDSGYSRNEIGKITGSVSTEQRKEAQDGLNLGKLKVLFLATKAAGEGLNLQKNANKVIHLTTPWNPALLQQATDRVHRRGQQEKVTVHRPIMRDTIEERIEEVIHKKKQLAEAVLGSGNEDLRIEKLTYSDLLAIAGTTESEIEKLKKGKKND